LRARQYHCGLEVFIDPFLPRRREFLKITVSKPFACKLKIQIQKSEGRQRQRDDEDARKKVKGKLQGKITS
jgi:hypothetical protein